MPNYLISQAPGRVVLRNYEGVISTYSEPGAPSVSDEDYNNASGVSSLLVSKQQSLEPKDLERRKRTLKS